MCNINALFVKQKGGKITPFIMGVSSNSFASNSDGEGIYISSSDKVHKSMVKMNMFEHENDIENSNVIISHQRLSTSGFELEYNHPFDNDDFVLVHNGVINQFKGEIGSDTYGFWLKFNEEFNAIKTKSTREQKIIQVIKKLFKVNQGSYSILIFDKKTNESYYFRGADYPGIYFYQNKNYLFITTNGHNYNFLPMLCEDDFVELDIKTRKIYKIDANGMVFNSEDLPKEIVVANTNTNTKKNKHQQKKFDWFDVKTYKNKFDSISNNEKEIDNLLSEDLEWKL